MLEDGIVRQLDDRRQLRRPFLLPLALGDVDEGDDDAADHVAQRAIGPKAHEEGRIAVDRGHLALDERQVA